MWSTASSVETDVERDALWDTFVEVHSGRLRVPGGDDYLPAGPLQVGTTVEIIPEGTERMMAIVTELEPPALYADETVFDGLTITFRHRFEAIDGGTRVTHELVIDGEGADEVGPELGLDISAGFPDQLAVLVAAARGRG